MLRMQLRRSAAAAAVVLAVAVAGCGTITKAVNSLTGEQAYKLLTSAKTAASSASSVHMTGNFTQNGQPAAIDVSFAGSDLAGTVSQGGGGLAIVEKQGTVYIKVTPGFLKAQHQPASLCSLLCNKYIKAPASAAGSFLATFKLTTFMSSAFAGLPTSASAFRGITFDKSTVAGQDALCATGKGYTVCLAGDGTPYFLRITGKNGKEAISFSHWNSVPAIQPPPASQTIDGRKFGL